MLVLTRFGLTLLTVSAAISATSDPQAVCFSSILADGPPGNEFLVSADSFVVSTVYANTVQQCGLQYPDCFKAKSVPYVTSPGFVVSDTAVCREVLRYTIPATPTFAPTTSGGGSSLTADCHPPDLTDPCSCQLPASDLSGNITFEFSASTENCCQQCTCVGDVSI